MPIFYISYYSNDGSTLLGKSLSDSQFEVRSNGIFSTSYADTSNYDVYIDNLVGITKTVNSKTPLYKVGDTFTGVFEETYYAIQSAPDPQQEFIDDMNALASSIKTKSGSANSMTIKEMKVAVDGITTAKPEEEKTVSITANGTNTVTPTSGKVLKKVTITTNIEGRKPEETKTVDITENGTQTITPTSGKVLSSVTVNTNVASSGVNIATVTISSNDGTEFLGEIPSGFYIIRRDGIYDLEENLVVEIPSLLGLSLTPDTIIPDYVLTTEAIFLGGVMVQNVLIVETPELVIPVPEFAYPLYAITGEKTGSNKMFDELMTTRY